MPQEHSATFTLAEPLAPGGQVKWRPQPTMPSGSMQVEAFYYVPRIPMATVGKVLNNA